jgi:GWxTD domain-containing protein
MFSTNARPKTPGFLFHPRCWNFAGTILLALLPTIPISIQAQSPADRIDLERFRDSLASTSDSTGLLVLEKRIMDSAKVERGNSLLHLKLGFLSLRLGDLGGNSHYDDAASEFQWAIDLQPTWPYPWYGMGLAEYGVGDSRVSFVTGLKAMLGKDALTRSAVAFAKSAEVDPGFVRGLADLANTALRQRVDSKLGVALEALRRAGHTGAGGDPRVLLVRGRVEREVGDEDSALAAFNDYLQYGPNRGLGLLEVSRTRFLLGRFDGLIPYFEGAAIDDTASVAGYRADLATIASDSVLREFDQQRGPHRAGYLRRFWEQRDRVELRSEGERLREHYRRLFYARKNFQLTSNNRQYDLLERYRSGSRDVDDRGVIYIRHGEPSSRASYAAPGVEPNESWRYSRPDGDLIFHFIAREDVQDFKLVESLFDVLGFSDAVKPQGTADGAEDNAMAEQLMLSREQLSPIYRRLQDAVHTSTFRYQSQERRSGQESIALGTNTDSYELRFPKELKARWEVLAVGQDSTGYQVQIAYAIAGSSLEPVPVTRGYLYSVRLRFVATEGGQVVASLDTTRHFVAPAPVPPNEHLVGRVGTTVPAGTIQYRLALQQGEVAGITIPRHSVRVGPLNSAALSVSDLVLGARSANLAWRRTADDTVLFNPLRRYRRSDEMELYYEIEGLKPGPYTVKLTVRKKGSGGGILRKIFGGGAAIRLKFDDLATRSTVSTHRRLHLDRVKPGNYVLELVVADAEGRKDRRRQEFQVVEEEKPVGE